jgi:hypothetical protein
MAGTWTGPSGQSIVEEHWTQPRAGTMFGVNRTMQNDATVFFEYLRIEHRTDGVYYLASPNGRNPPTPFKMISHIPSKIGGRVIFANPEHDFPQRIVYQREGDVMTSQIEGMRSGRLAVEGWTWQRVK